MYANNYYLFRTSSTKYYGSSTIKAHPELSVQVLKLPNKGINNLLTVPHRFKIQFPLSVYQLLIGFFSFRSQPKKLSRQRRVHPRQLLHPWAFRRSRLYSKVVLITGKTASEFWASILSMTTTAAPSTSPATPRPSLVGCGPWSCLWATKTGPCQNWALSRCTTIRLSTRTLRTGPLTDSRSTGWKRCSRRVPTGASRAHVIPGREWTTETTCAPTSQSSTRWLSTVMQYARKPSTWTYEATTARAAQAFGGSWSNSACSITTVNMALVSLGKPAVLYFLKTTLGGTNTLPKLPLLHLKRFNHQLLVWKTRGLNIRYGCRRTVSQVWRLNATMRGKSQEKYLSSGEETRVVRVHVEWTCCGKIGAASKTYRAWCEILC